MHLWICELVQVLGFLWDFRHWLAEKGEGWSRNGYVKGKGLVFEHGKTDLGTENGNGLHKINRQG